MAGSVVWPARWWNTLIVIAASVLNLSFLLTRLNIIYIWPESLELPPIKLYILKEKEEGFTPLFNKGGIAKKNMGSGSGIGRKVGRKVGRKALFR